MHAYMYIYIYGAQPRGGTVFSSLNPPTRPLASSKAAVAYTRRGGEHGAYTIYIYS